MVFEEKLKKAMEQKGMTMYRLSKEMCVHQTTVSNWVNGKSTPKLEQLQQLAEILDISFSNLVGTATLIDGVYTHEEMKTALQAPAKPTAVQIGAAYEKATPPVQRTVEVALEPFMDKAGDEDAT